MTDDNFKLRPLDGLDIDIVERDGNKIIQALVDSAVWADTGENLSDEDLECLNEDYQLIEEIAYETQY